MLRRIALLTVPILLAFPALTFAFQGFVQSVGDGGTISWGNGEIVVVRSLVAEGEGESAQLSSLSIRRAASNARKHMLDIIMSTRIDSKRTVSAYLSEDDELAARVRGVVQNSLMERPAVFDQGGEVRVSESFRGKLAELILPTTIQFQSGIPPKLPTSMEQSLDYNTEVPERVGAGVSSYTGVIVDARGLKVTPSLVPVIYGQDGVGAYGAFLVSRANAISKGVAAFANSADPVILRERVGARPLSVKAVSTFGSWRTDLIVPSGMGRLIRAVMRQGEAVDECRVVIVIDAPEPVDAEGTVEGGDILPDEENVQPESVPTGEVQ